MIASRSARAADRRKLLGQEIDEASRADRTRALRALLRRPLLLPHGETQEDFARVRRHAEFLRQWFAHHLGWSLTCTAETARLRKIPADANASRAASDIKGGGSF